MKIEARKYQSEAVKRICDSHKKNPKSRIVLAAATGSGKTEMSVMIIDDFIKNNLGKVLVITHHTNVIKDNYTARLDEIKPDFTYSTEDEDCEVFICIRQKIVKIDDLSKFSLVVVDEAHQNYFSKTIQSIINKIEHQVLLTATPSKFVRKGGYDIIPIGRLDIPDKYFAKLNFVCVNSDNQITQENLNRYGDLRSDTKINDTEMHSMIRSILPHLGDKKKLFVFRNINQAKRGSRVLNIYGIDAPVSDSKSDSDGLLVDNFKTNGLNALCVVDRMRLGYSDNDLYYTIDLTFSHNPNTIYQMMSRSNRGNQTQSKYYIKLTNDELDNYTRVMVSVAISLFKNDNIVRFNGTNFNGISIPILGVSKVGSLSRKVLISKNIIIPKIVNDIVNFFEDCDFADADLVLNTLKLKQTINRTRAKWTKEEVIELSSKYNDLKPFRLENRSAYQHAQNHNYLNDLKLKRAINKTRGKWTKEEVIELSSKYDELKPFRLENSSAYYHARKNNYLNELKLKRITRRWTKKEVLELSSKYDELRLFQLENIGAYNHARRHTYLNDLKLKRERKRWLKKEV